MSFSERNFPNETISNRSFDESRNNKFIVIPFTDGFAMGTIGTIGLHSNHKQTQQQQQQQQPKEEKHVDSKSYLDSDITSIFSNRKQTPIVRIWSLRCH